MKKKKLKQIKNGVKEIPHVKSEKEIEEEKKKKILARFPFLYNLMERRKKSVDRVYEVKKIKLDVLEGKSLWLFDKDNKYRKTAFKVAKNFYTEAFIIICIIISTASLSY